MYRHETKQGDTIQSILVLVGVVYKVVVP
jgi:hypothetical protein